MFALWMFGREVERTLGSRRYAVMYLAPSCRRALVQLLVVVDERGRQTLSDVGASGGVFGVLLRLRLILSASHRRAADSPDPDARVAVRGLYGLIELVSGVVGTKSGIAHFAHLGGMLGAFIVLRYWRSQTR
jgi:membrane associated rhomboid family serine protease